MTAPAAMQADYCDLRFIKGRKVIQVVLELPIEAGAQFVSMFGTPDPSKTVPVAIARMGNGSAGDSERASTDASVANTSPAATKSDKAKRKWDELSIAQQAGILCGEKRFQMFVAERMGFSSADTDDAALYIRRQCGVNSRAHIEGKPEATRIFRDLETSFEAWKLL